MTSHFTALPLGSGEAFLLQTSHEGRNWAILVDSGNLEAGTPHPLVAAIVKAAPKLRQIDVSICTHHDLDHARGFRTFFDAWCSGGRTIGEIWLPGRWSAALPKALFDPLGLIEALWKGAGEATERLVGPDEMEPQCSSIDERLRALAHQRRIDEAFTQLGVPEEVREEFERQTSSDSERSRDWRVANSLGVTVEQIQTLDNLSEESSKPPSIPIRRLERSLARRFESWPYPFFDGEHMRRVALFFGAIETASTITTIAESAVRWRIPIRWFDFGQFEQQKHARGGIAGFLEPVCAVELDRPPPGVSDLVLFLCLSLTKQNVESLVFHRVETDIEPGVMFLGDSRLSFGIDGPKEHFPKPRGTLQREMLVTAPHHGSRVNDVAYSIVDEWFGGNGVSPIYVRNGGHHKMKIGAFLDQPNRCCAQCRICSTSKLARAISLTSRRGRWHWPTKRVPKCKIASP